MDIKKQKKILFGAAYYDEYSPISHIDEDMSLLSEAHMNMIRVGEGSWSHWEPEDGIFSLDWLQPVLDKAYTHGIKVIIGVPTFAIPQWLARKYPEVALHDNRGNSYNFGKREEHSLSHPVFLFYSRRIIEKIVKRYAEHPAVIGWQLHNEPGAFINYSHDTFEGFKDYLRHKYGTVEKLNRDWGLVYWSHELSTWDDLWKPEGNAQPQYDIEWRKYQAILTNNLLKSQRNIIKAIAPKDQFVTVNIAFGRDASDEYDIGKVLDIASSDPYFYMQNGMKLPNPDILNPAWFVCGPWQISLQGDRSYSVKQKSYYVAENNGGPIGGSADNYPAFNGQWRQAAWQFISRGARMIEYWPWRQINFGTETYWGGIIPHDGKPGRVYNELSELGEELDKFSDELTNLKPDHDITMLYSVNSRWALSFEPYIAEDATVDPHMDRNPKAYDHLFSSFYEGAFISGRQVRLISDSQIVEPEDEKILKDPKEFASENPILVAAGTYISSDALIEWLHKYVDAGGHLILGPKSTYGDKLAKARFETKPSRLVDLASTYYQEFSNLRKSIPAVSSGIINLRKGSAATEWVDCLISKNSEILVKNDDPYFSQFPLVTTHRNISGSGRVTIVGTIPNKELAASIFDYVLPGEKWISGHDTVSHSSAVNGNGDHIHFLFNWNWTPIKLELPERAVLLGTKSFVNSVNLGPWDVSILKTKN
ncbi:putative beta-galactosidase [Oenococcus oeni]|uniref:beta-galactosidase n=1 Tax=Oenococcus oeni TaxID=1247 RepID=UPI0010BA43C5|nr:alpha-amylase family protein [Oenococcus oeni]SYW12781.1 putative beta-galactosidase [Oenococcus oeni]